jgi:hypothetical protein
LSHSQVLGAYDRHDSSGSLPIAVAAACRNCNTRKFFKQRLSPAQIACHGY